MGVPSVTKVPPVTKSRVNEAPPQTIPGKKASGHSFSTEQKIEKDTGSTQIQKPTPPPPKSEISDQPIHGEVVTNIGNTLNKVADKLSALKTKNDEDDEENVFIGTGFYSVVD